MPREHAKKQRRRRKAKGESPEGEDAPLKVWPEKIIGLKYVRLLEKQLDQLRGETAHGNQELYLDDVFVAYLLAFFNSTVRSLRTIEDLSQTQQLQKHLTIRRICKSTLSDFNQLVDPERLTPIIQSLRRDLNRKEAGQRKINSDLNALLDQAIAVDGTFLPAVAKVAWAVGHTNAHAVRHRARLDASVNVTTWLPEAIVVPEPGQSESDSAIENIRAGRIYLYDRGYTGFALLKAHYEQVDDAFEVKSHFVVRYKKVGGNSPALNNAIDLHLVFQF